MYPFMCFYWSDRTHYPAFPTITKEKTKVIFYYQNRFCGRFLNKFPSIMSNAAATLFAAVFQVSVFHLNLLQVLRAVLCWTAEPRASEEQDVRTAGTAGQGCSGDMLPGQRSQMCLWWPRAFMGGFIKKKSGK